MGMDCKIHGCENKATYEAVTPFGDVPICDQHAREAEQEGTSLAPAHIFEALKVAALAN